MKNSPLILIAAGLAIASSLSASMIHSWSFNESVGTLLSATSGSGTAFDANIATGTNGSGQFNLGGANFGAGASAIAPLSSAAAITSGQLILDVAFTSWSATENRPAYEFNFLNSEGTIIAGLLVDVGNSGVFFGAVSTTGFDTSSDDDLSAPRSNPSTPYIIRLTLDYDTSTYSSFASVGGSDFFFLASESFDDPNFDDSLSAVELVLFAEFNGLSTSFLVDSITVSVVPEPSAFAALAGLLALGFVAIRRNRRS